MPRILRYTEVSSLCHQPFVACIDGSLFTLKWTFEVLQQFEQQYRFELTSTPMIVCFGMTLT